MIFLSGKANLSVSVWSVIIFISSHYQVILQLYTSHTSKLWWIWCSHFPSYQGFLTATFTFYWNIDLTSTPKKWSFEHLEIFKEWASYLTEINEETWHMVKKHSNWWCTRFSWSPVNYSNMANIHHKGGYYLLSMVQMKSNFKLSQWDLFSLSVQLRNVVRRYFLKSNDPDFHEFDIHN